MRSGRSAPKAVVWNETHVFGAGSPLSSINVLSAPATAKSMGLSRSVLGPAIGNTTSGAGSTDGAGAVGVTSAARAVSRSSRSCFNTSLVTMATMSAVLPAASGTPSGAAGKSSGRPAAAATVRRRRMGGGGAGDSASAAHFLAARRWWDGGLTLARTGLGRRPRGGILQMLNKGQKQRPFAISIMAPLWNYPK